jgi:hypothetical protein
MEACQTSASLQSVEQASAYPCLAMSIRLPARAAGKAGASARAAGNHKAAL